MYDDLALLARWCVLSGIVLVFSPRLGLYVQAMQLVVDPHTQILRLNPSAIGQGTVVGLFGICCPVSVGLIETSAMPGGEVSAVELDS